MLFTDVSDDDISDLLAHLDHAIAVIHRLRTWRGAPKTQARIADEALCQLELFRSEFCDDDDDDDAQLSRIP